MPVPFGPQPRSTQTPVPSGGTAAAFGHGLALAGITCVVFALTMTNGFVGWDDAQLIGNNPMLRAGGSVWPAWRGPYEGLYAPLTYTLYAAVAAVARAADSPTDPAFFHATSLLLHVFAGLLLWRWLRRLCGCEGPAFVAALFWLIHPVQVEAVCWAASLNTVLGGLLAIAALYAATRGVTAGRRRWPWLAGSVAAVALSLSAKPSNVLLPLMLVAVHRPLLRRPWRETLAIAATWSVVAVPFAAVGRFAQTIGSESGGPVTLRPVVALHAVGFYLLRVVCPNRLAIDYGLTPFVVLQGGRWVVPAFVSAGAILLAVVQRHRRPWLVAGLGLFLAALGPVIGLVPFVFQGFSTVADRYAYVALAGVALALASAGRELPPRPFGRLAVAVVLAALAVSTAWQTTVWHDTTALMTQCLAVNPDSLTANAELGAQAERASDFVFAESAFRRVLRLRPLDAVTRSELADVLLRAGHFGEAVDEYRRVADERPTVAHSFIGLARAESGLGHFGQARIAYEKAVALDAQNEDAAAGLAALPRSRPGTAPAAEAGTP